ncbi:MAG: DUF4382 domain-containing protein [Acidobacteriota bacterium]
MKKSRIHSYTVLGISLVLSLAVVAIVGCGGNNSSSSNPTTGTVNTFISDPPTCSLQDPAVYVTITKVLANVNANAAPNSSGWQTLVDLTNDPQQVDLMTLNPDATKDFCGTLFKLGTKALPPGKYQQIRLILLANNASSGPSSNACTDKADGTTYGWNCVVSSNKSYHELQLPSEAQTGIKIPSSQITNGGLTVTAGQSVDFNINFDSCASIVQEGTGQYSLKPVLHAGEVTLNGENTISGKVVEGAGAPNPGTGIGSAIVLLEQPDTSTTPPTDRVIWAGTTNPDGTFAFCPVASSSTNYDVVVAGTTTETTASGTTTTTYNPSVVFGVPVGGATGSIPLFAETASGTGGTGPAQISGQITTSGSSTVGGDVQLSALQSVTDGSNTVNITVPVLQSTSTPTGNVTMSQPPIYTTVDTTSANGGCAAGSTDCVGYTIAVPASAAAFGTYDSSSGNNVQQATSTNSATYTINALADGSTNTTLNSTLLSCTPTAANSDAVTVEPGQSVTQGNDGSLVLGLTGCTAPTP